MCCSCQVFRYLAVVCILSASIPVLNPQYPTSTTGIIPPVDIIQYVQYKNQPTPIHLATSSDTRIPVDLGIDNIDYHRRVDHSNPRTDHHTIYQVESHHAVTAQA